MQKNKTIFTESAFTTSDNRIIKGNYRIPV